MFKKGSDSHDLIMAQIRDVENCLNRFEVFMRAAATVEVSPRSLTTLFDDVSIAEDQADRSLRKMIDSAGRAGYLPSTREDLISIATSCDKIANKCEYVAYLVTMYNFQFPESFAKDFADIFDLTEQQFALLEEAIGMLFSKMNQLQKDPAILDRIRALETQIDRVESRIGHRIFDMDIELAAKMQFFGIVEALCDISDIIEDVADKIQIMLIARKA